MQRRRIEKKQRLQQLVQKKIGLTQFTIRWQGFCWVFSPFSKVFFYLHCSAWDTHLCMDFYFVSVARTARDLCHFHFRLKLQQLAAAFFHLATHQQNNLWGGERKEVRGRRRTRLVANRISLFFQFISFPSHFFVVAVVVLCVYIVRMPFCFHKLNCSQRSFWFPFKLHTHTHRQSHPNGEQLWAGLPCKSA